jgi:hypothetical protein
MRIDGRELSLTSAYNESPQQLLKEFFAVQKLLSGTVVGAALKA